MATTTAVAPAPSRAGHTAYAATIGLGASVLMAAAGLGAAYLSFRYGQTGFVDADMKFDNYVGVLITFSMLLSSFACTWAVTSARVGRRRWAATGFGLSAVIGVASLNLVWFIGQEIGLPAVGGTAYAILVYALLVVGGLAIASGIGASIAGCITAFGGHANPSSPTTAHAYAVGQHLAGLAWIVVFVLIFLKK